jgi:hypothetical protein
MNSSSELSSQPQTTIDNEKLQQFMGKVLSDFGGAASAVLVYIGGQSHHGSLLILLQLLSAT